MYGYISDEALLSLESMEGVEGLPRKKASGKLPTPLWPGYLAAATITTVAFLLHKYPPFGNLSTAILAMTGGMLARNSGQLPRLASDGAKRVAMTVIPITIVLTGAGLDLTQIATIGFRSLVLILTGIGVATATAIWVGEVLGVWRKTAILIGAGTAICGTSAIVAVAPVIGAEDEDLLLSIGTINLVGLVAMFTLPLAGKLLHMGDDAFGVWAGVSIHAVPQVVAAGFAFSKTAGALATLVKLVRVTMLAPFLFVLGLMQARVAGKGSKVGLAGLIPSFVWGFLALAIVNTLGLFPILQFKFGSVPMSSLLTLVGEWLLTLSMAAMGMEVNIRFFARVGGTAIVTGLAAAAVLAAVSLLMIRLLIG